MIDTMTRKPLQVSTVGTVGPFIILAYSQLPELCELLDKHEVGYWVEEDVISFNGEPETVGVDFGRTGNASAIQAILDNDA